MKHFNKLFILLAFLGLSISSVNAQFPSGDGSSGDPYQIATGANLADLATFVNDGDVNYNSKFYILTNNIDLSGYQSGSGWTPIGNGTTNTFKGNFNGNGKTITNLTITNTKGGYLGLFGSVDGGTIANLGIEDADLKNQGGAGTANAVGGVVGYLNNNSEISNCYSTGTISTSGNNGATAGGIIGTISGSTISNCYSAMEVKSSGQGARSGGIVGNVSDVGTVLHCYSIGAVICSGSGSSGVATAGGIAGNNVSGCKIEYCAALNPSITCTANGTKNFGRVVGNNAGTLTNNIGFDEMLNPDGNTTWGNVGLTLKDGADFSKQEIYEDGTLGGRFSASDGWTITNGYLPGLFGKPVEMPAHLSLDTPLCNPVTELTAVCSGNDVILSWTPPAKRNVKLAMKEINIAREGMNSYAKTVPGAKPSGDTVNRDASKSAWDIGTNSFTLKHNVLNDFPGGTWGMGAIFEYEADGKFNFVTLSQAARQIIGYEIPMADKEYIVSRDGVEIATIYSTTYTDVGGGEEAHEWCITVKCENGGFSSPECVSLPGCDCNPPTNLAVEYNSECEALLTWDAPASKGIKESEIVYNIYRNGAFIATVDDELNYTDSGFDPSESYEWYVTQVCEFGESDPSNIVSLAACKVGIAETPLMESVQVYPNPTSGELRIESGELRIESVDIFDIYGRNVGSIFPSKNLEGWQPQAEGVVFDISHFPAGIYFLKIHTENGIVTKKVVKE